MQGKIIKGIGGFYYVHDGIGKVYECRAKGIFRNRGIKPLVGDDVEISVLDEEKATGNLDEILPRKNRLIRPAVSNVDQAVVVFAITDPMPNLNLLRSASVSTRSIWSMQPSRRSCVRSMNRRAIRCILSAPTKNQGWRSFIG